MTRENLKEKYQGKLQPQYENSYHAVVSQVFRGLSGRRILTPSTAYQSHHGQQGVKCSIKASEGFLYMFDKSFMFVPKPATYIAFDNVISITMSRVGGAVSASRTFDIAVAIKGGVDYQFSNINREEQTSLEDFFKLKNLRTKNEMLDDVSCLIHSILSPANSGCQPQSATLMAAALNDADMGSSDEEVVAARADRGSADEDDESVDDDFQASSSDEGSIAEEYDSAHESSPGGSDDEMEDAGGDDEAGGKVEVAERPKKKVKTEK